MFNELLLPGTISFRETLAIYLEEIKDFINEICYKLARFELRF